MRQHDLGGPALRSGWAPFYLLTGFIAGALSMLGVILWVLSDREMGFIEGSTDATASFEGPGGRWAIRGALTESPPS